MSLPHYDHEFSKLGPRDYIDRALLRQLNKSTTNTDGRLGSLKIPVK